MTFTNNHSSLLNFRGMGLFQIDNGVIVAGQVHDEIGQRLKDTVPEAGSFVQRPLKMK